MRILSWDVGLKTLSYCLLRVERVRNTELVKWVPIIEQWESIDVSSEYQNRAGGMDVSIDSGIVSVSVDEAPRGKQPRTKRVVKKASPKLTLEKCVEAVHQSLSRRSSFLLCTSTMPDAIIIEQQPAGGHNIFSSVNMKVISHVIQAYYYNLIDTSRCTIGFVSPASKLVEMRAQDKAHKIPVKGVKTALLTDTCSRSSGCHEMCCETQSAAPLDEIELATPERPAKPARSRTLMGQRYRKNKQFAVTKTQELLAVAVTHNAYAINVLKECGKKKDDLCDAFLLGYYYGIKQ